MMPVFLFTYHAYGTRLPDREQGYVRRKQGTLPPDEEAAKLYRDQMQQDAVSFGGEAQLQIIQAVRNTEPHIDITIRMVVTDPTHAHVLLQWTHERGWKSLRTSVKTAISIALKKQQDKAWLSEGASAKQVKDEAHLHYLENQYLPDHRGWKWSSAKGLFK